MINLSVRVINIELPREAETQMRSELKQSFVKVENIRSTSEKSTDEILDTIEGMIDTNPNALNIVNVPANMRHLANGIYDLIQSRYSEVNYFDPNVEKGHVDEFLRFIKGKITDYERAELKKASSADDNTYHH